MVYGLSINERININQIIIYQSETANIKISKFTFNLSQKQQIFVTIYYFDLKMKKPLLKGFWVDVVAHGLNYRTS